MDAMLLSTGGSGASGASAVSGYSYGTDGSGDANAALAELDQGLRCGRLGEQSEAIVRFPRLFAKYPFPILINSALLKLADIFKQCGNFTKLCVLRVVQQSERHLDKITNVDEFVKRISGVLHSNDPVARALTLRLLGSVAVIIPERKQVHHSVQNALDSHDSSVELEAAIFAAGKFAAHSESFSVNVCAKIGEMVGGYATPLDMKLKLISVFQNMQRLDSSTSALVRQTLLNLLPVYPSQDFAVVTLHTLTLLSAHSLVDVPDQVELLLRHLVNDPRKAVKRQILIDLRFLANQDYAHLWSQANVSSTIRFASSSASTASSSASSASSKAASASAASAAVAAASGAVLCGALDVLSDLVRHTPDSMDKFEVDDENSLILKLCQNCAYSKKVNVVARGTLLLTLLASNSVKEKHHLQGVDIGCEASMAIEALFLLINSGGQESSTTLAVLRECLKSMVMLCKVNADACDQFVDVVGGLLPAVTANGQDQTTQLLCQGLASLGDMKIGVLNPLLPEICHQIKQQDDHQTITLLASLIFQTVKGRAWTGETESAIGAACESLDMWSAYRLARAASRYGHHQVAHKIFQSMSLTGVSSEHFYFWLTGLAQVALGETVVNGLEVGHRMGLVERLNQGRVDIIKGHASIKASSATPTGSSLSRQSHDFRLQYLRCRSEMLSVLSQTVASCNSMKTSPPPAIANTQAKQTHDDLQRCGRVTQLLRQCVKDFACVASMYGGLYETSFDADNGTLAHVQVLQHICSSVSQWIEMVCLKSSLQGSIFSDSSVEFSANFLAKPVADYGVDIQGLVQTGRNIAQEFRNLMDPKVPPPISRMHTQCLVQVVELLASEQMCLPRLFFQTLQSTNIKLAVTPQPRSPNEPINVPSSQHIAIKVEGVITTSGSSPMTSSVMTSSSKKRAPFRSIDSIKLSLNSVLQTPNAKEESNAAVTSSLKEAAGGGAGTMTSLEQTVKPHNDFFSAQFLLPFAIAGTYCVVIETRLMDEEEQTWKQTGLNTVLNIKAFEDGQARMQTGRGSRQQP